MVAAVAKTQKVGKAVKVSPKASPKALKAESQRAKAEDISDVMQKYRQISKIESIKYKDQESTDSAKQILESLNFGDKLDEGEFMQVHNAEAIKNIKEPARLVVDISGKTASKLFFRDSIGEKTFGWITRLFGGADRSLGRRLVANENVLDLADPDGFEITQEIKSSIQADLKTGRYSVSVVYDANKEGKFVKPEAIALIDNLGHENSKLKSFGVIDYVLVSDSEKYIGDEEDNSRLLAADMVLHAVSETMSKDAVLFAPHVILGGEEPLTKNRHHINGLKVNAVVEQDGELTNKTINATLNFGRGQQRDLPSKALAKEIAELRKYELISAGDHDEDRVTELCAKYQQSLETAFNKYNNGLKVELKKEPSDEVRSKDQSAALAA
jgi:hypothetical protein